MAKYSNDASYAEEEVQGERSFEDDPIEDGKQIIYDEEEYLAEVGEMNCYCVPTRVYGFKDFMYRTLGWTLLNKEQILGAFTGEYIRTHVCNLRNMSSGSNKSMLQLLLLRSQRLSLEHLLLE